jgi:uncharacterized membrane protein
MKEITTRKDFLKQLKRKLRFEYPKEDVSSVLSDYEEFFAIEAAQGKSESEICAALGDPVAIVQSLTLEMQSHKGFGNKIFTRRTILRSINVVIICCTIMNILYKLSRDYGASMLMNLLISFPVIALFLWMALREPDYNLVKTSDTKSDLWKAGGAHLICFCMVLFLFFFVNNIVTSKEYLLFYIKYEQIGKFVVSILRFSIVILCGIIVFAFYQFKRNPILYYSVICHVLGAVAMILYYINVLHSLADLHTYSDRIMKSGFLYLESMAMIALLFILSHKKERCKWMLN